MPNAYIMSLISELSKSFEKDSKNAAILYEMQTLWEKQYASALNNIERFRAVVDNIIDGIITIDNKGKIQTFNNAAKNLFGYEDTEVIGQNVKMLMPEPYHSEHDGYLDNYKNSGIKKIIGIGRQVTGLRKDGSTFPLDLAVSKINLGKKVMFAGILRDISESNRQKEELTQSYQRLESILNSVYEGIITINDIGTIDSFNLAAEKIFGYEAKEVMDKNVKMLMPEPYYSEHDGYLDNYKQGGKPQIIGIGREVQGRKKDGSIFSMNLAVTKIKNYDQNIFVGTVRDLTEQKRLEKLKNEFVSTVSHELRTPLTSIRGALSLIDSGVMGEIGEKIAPLVQIALKNSERLILLINDILDIEKIESGKMNFDLKEVNLNDLINKAIEANEGYAKANEATLLFKDINNKIQVYVDENRMLQVLTNLISNAVKYSPKNGIVDLKIVPSKHLVHVEIHDNGLGIPDEFKKRIFQKFAQADSSDTKQKGGTGLGLNISKAIIEKFGGSIGFLSPKGRGTTFFFDLPIIYNIKAVSEELKQVRGKILVVEDDHDIATLLRIMLKKEEIECDIAYNAKEAKEFLKRKKYDAMTLDIMLPDQDGLSLLEEIRQEGTLKDLPVVIVSAKADTTKKFHPEMELEVVDWINKPIDQKQLAISLEKAIHLGTHLPRILHVEDDPDIASLTKILLDELGEIDLAMDKASALHKLKTIKYDLILLDMMLPDGSSEELIPLIKEQYDSMPIVLFSAQEVGKKLKSQVSKALVKSRTSNVLLVDTIKKLLNN